RLDEHFGLKSVPAGLYPQALEDRSGVNLQTVVIPETAPRDGVDDQRVRLRDDRARPGSRSPHVPRVADDHVRLAHTAEELAERLVAPRIVAVNHHDVIQSCLVDTTAVRPSEAHIALVDEQLH